MQAFGLLPFRMRIIVAGSYLLYAAVILRTIANPNLHGRLPLYLALELLHASLFSLALRSPAGQPLWKHIYFAFQSLLALVLVLLRPQFDFIVVLFVMLSLQAALILQGRAVWIWVAISSLLTGGPLMLALGALRGLSLALMPMTIGLVLPAYVAVMQEIEAALSRTRLLLENLQETHERLAATASQVEELSAMEQRNRLARQLHDSVSQTIFSISLQTRATQILMEREPDRVRPQLQQLQTLAREALAEMRELIAGLRPPPAEPARRPPS